MEKLTIYNKEKEFEKFILPEIEKIKDLCVKNDIPFLMSFAVGNTEESTVYKTDGLLPGIQDIKLKDNKLKDMVSIMTGYSEPESMDLMDLDDDFPKTI